ncbi:flagellar biosynthesis protein FlhF [Shewanella algae]|uniref:Flagellar biosynthesis protein FlhF n=1 Tax=bacterium 19CA01SA08 TaxID=2920574 RepID=A0AAU6VN23_UNCXX|nr:MULTISPECIES: flagellar biosynthesis protein FlhF [Shewanella]EKT4485852.1 flagellar biosynthesis protein FlhF [Shewanella algae]MBO2547201.1 flagellar biosynthesis protein FlhF [Shewanella algae]MBO2674509.1 flagellar biosynthesis protein FlhF [Shewanella algae]MBO2687266.1 flagellar biosynthesis protein FlhF [Shewanella algae]MDE0568051.1 flagellar biosynthesis protein FlhF [Shewanella sp. K8]
MKIKRFFAKDMRAALAQVKETLGADAVIMSNKKVTGGIEIVAAVDYDSPKPAAAPTASPFMELGEDKVSLGSGHVRSNSKTNPEPVADSLQALLERQQSRLNEQLGQQNSAKDLDMPAWAKGLGEEHKPAPQLREKTPERASKGNSVKQQQEMEAMREELASLRGLLTHQLSSLMSDQRSRTDPVGAMLKRKLLEAEFSPDVAERLASLSQHYQSAELGRALPQSLANLLDNQGDDLMRQGGIVALVGPTGVGKTTTLAKLAARFIAHHGPDSVLLVTMDHYRIGAFEQLATYGKIMGCPVKQAHDLNELEQILYQFRSRKLVLIDTAGMGQRDMRLYQQLDNLAANTRLPIRSYLVLSATGQRRVLEEAVSHFQRIDLAGAVLTKLDESVSLGAALSVLIQSGLSLSYITDGQRVPEDMQVADTLTLAKQALAVLNKTEASHFNNKARSEEMTYAFE